MVKVRVFNPDTKLLLAEGEGAYWRDAVLRAMNQRYTEAGEELRHHVHDVREVGGGTLVQCGRRIPGTSAIDLDPAVVVEIETTSSDHTNQTR